MSDQSGAAADAVLVRPGRPQDVPAGAEVWRAALAAAGTRPSAARLQETQELLASRDAVLVVAVERDEVVGLARGSWVAAAGGGFQPGLLRLDLLVVAPPARRRGTGTALAEGLADTAWPKGARSMVATPDSDSTRDFLLACGFEPDGFGDLVAELEAPVREVAVSAAGLRLGQLLKLAGLVETGAQGKALLEAGEVEVDGEVETRRGRQLRDGEVVTAHGDAVRVVLPGD